MKELKEKFKRLGETLDKVNRLKSEIAEVVHQYPVKEVTVYDENNIRLDTENFFCDFYIYIQRDEWDIKKVCSANTTMPEDEDEIIQMVKDMQYEKMKFEEVLDDIYAALRERE
jgi:hypothetical protein